MYCPGRNATALIWRVLVSSDDISFRTPLKPQHSNPNPNPLAYQLWCIDFLTPPSPLIIPQRLAAFLESLMPLKNWCSIHARWSKSSLKHFIRFCCIFPKFKKRILLHIAFSHVQIAFLKFTSCDNQALVGFIRIPALVVHLKLKSWKFLSHLIRTEFSRVYNNFKCPYEKVWKRIVCTSYETESADNCDIQIIFFLENETREILRHFEMQRNYKIAARRQNVPTSGFCLSNEPWRKIKESVIDRYLDHARELKEVWDMKVTVIPIVGGVFGMVPKGIEIVRRNWESNEDNSKFTIS